MTDIEELRRWSAERVMGWKFILSSPKNPQPNEFDIYIMTWDEDGDADELMSCIDWQPDNPHTGQIWLIVEKMRELGWKLMFDATDDYIASFYQDDQNPLETFEGCRNDNPCLAILKAAKAALEGGDAK